MADVISKEELDEYFTDDAERKALDRKSGDLSKKHERLKKRIVEFVKARGGNDRTTVHHGYVLALTERAGTTQWREKFIEIAGNDAAEEARKKTPPTFILSVTRVAS